VAGFGIVTPPALLSAGGVAAPVLVPGSDGGSVVWPPASGTVSVLSSGTVAAGTVLVPGRASVPEPPGAGLAVPPVLRNGVAAGAAFDDDGDGADDLRWPRSTRRCVRSCTDRAIGGAADVDVVAVVDTADPAADPSSPARTTATTASASSAPVKKKRRWRRITTFSQRV
jgi:hypothetical protein